MPPTGQSSCEGYFSVLAVFFHSRDTLYAARMARDLLWENQESLDRDEFVSVSQT
jgi:hypothetical protein